MTDTLLWLCSSFDLPGRLFPTVKFIFCPESGIFAKFIDGLSVIKEVFYNYYYEKMSDILEKNLPLEIRNRALISPSGDYGWQKEYIFDALDEINALGYAIVGIEVWAVDTFQNDKTLTIFRDLFLTIKDVHINEIPCTDGVKRFNRLFDIIPGENWEEFVNRSAAESKKAIDDMNVEEQAVDNLKSMIFYNPVFMTREEFEYINS